jgi:hypothetical protein
VLAIICIPHVGHDGLCRLLGMAAYTPAIRCALPPSYGEIPAVRIRTVRLTYHLERKRQASEYEPRRHSKRGCGLLSADHPTPVAVYASFIVSVRKRFKFFTHSAGVA